jgi:hypothetical protein
VCVAAGARAGRIGCTCVLARVLTLVCSVVLDDVRQSVGRVRESGMSVGIDYIVNLLN